MTKKFTSLIKPIQEKLQDLKKTHGIEYLEKAEENIQNLTQKEIITYYIKYEELNSKETEKSVYTAMRLRLDKETFDHINSIQVKYRKKYDTVHSKRTGSQKNSVSFEVNTYEITHSFCAYIWIAEVEKLIYGDLT